SFEPTSFGWHASNLTSKDAVSTAFAREGTHAFHLVGGGQKSLSQTVSFGGGSSRRFILGACNRTNASSSSGGPVQLTAIARYADGSTSTWHVPFARATHAWT